MAVTTSNLIAGPGTLYTGAFGATEPADTAVASAPGGAFTDVGGTQDGVNINIQQEFFELEVDQIIDVPERRPTKRDVSVSTNMAEPTLENLALATNASANITTGTGFKKLTPVTDTSATQPNYASLLMDGFAPEQFQRRVIVRKALSTENVEIAYKKGEQTFLTCTWNAHYVSNSITPYVVIDEAPEES